ncbi:hypothetical protein D9M71_556540 [compost metagenome]
MHHLVAFDELPAVIALTGKLQVCGLEVVDRGVLGRVVKVRIPQGFVGVQHHVLIQVLLRPIPGTGQRLALDQAFEFHLALAQQVLQLAHARCLRQGSLYPQLLAGMQQFVSDFIQPLDLQGCVRIARRLIGLVVPRQRPFDGLALRGQCKPSAIGYFLDFDWQVGASALVFQALDILPGQSGKTHAFTQQGTQLGVCDLWR